MSLGAGWGNYLPNLPGDEGRVSSHPHPVSPWAEREFATKGASQAHAASAPGSRIKFPSQGCHALPPSKLILVQRERDEWRAAVAPCVGLGLQQK